MDGCVFRICWNAKEAKSIPCTSVIHFDIADIKSLARSK